MCARWVLLVASILPAAAALAQSGSIEVSQAWSRAAPQGRVGVLYLTITDTGQPDRLTGADTPVAERAELHESLTENGVMKMRPVASAPVSPDQPLVLKPGGYHIMLMNLRQALKAGDSFPVTLRFAGAGAVDATARVAPAGAERPAASEVPDMPGPQPARGAAPR